MPVRCHVYNETAPLVPVRSIHWHPICELLCHEILMRRQYNSPCHGHQGDVPHCVDMNRARVSCLPIVINATEYFRADSRFEPSQWETALLCNDVSHWLGPNLESSLYLIHKIPEGDHTVADWETRICWHSLELGSLLYSLYKIPLTQACFPLARPNFHSHWWASER